MEKISKHISVVGGGIMGISSAINLIKRGCKVTIIEKEVNGESASFGNASWLTSISMVPVLTPGAIYKIPSLLFSSYGPLFLRFPGVIKILPWLIKYLSYSKKEKVNYISKHLAPLLSNTVDEHKKISSGTNAVEWIKESPFLFVYKDKKDYEKDSFSWNIRKQYGFKWEYVENEKLYKIIPDLSRDYKFAVKIDGQGYIYNTKNYLRDLFDGFKKLGGKIIEDEVQDIISEKKQIIVKTKDREIISDNVVISAGVFSDKFSNKFGANVPLQSERGYHLELFETNIKLKYPIMNSFLKLAITPKETGIRFAGLVEFGSINSDPNKKVYDQLMRCAKLMFPDISFKEIYLFSFAKL